MTSRRLRQAVVLVGGRGTRLGALTDVVPKPLLDVAGRPFLDYLLDGIARHGFTRILLLCGYKSDLIAARYGGRMWRGAELACVSEPGAHGTAGALAHAAAHLDPRFLLLNGDTLFDINLLDLGTAPCPGIGIMALRQSGENRRYGAIQWDGDRVTGFAERGSSTLSNGGIYAMSRRVLEHIAPPPTSLEHDVFPRLAEAGLLHGRLYDSFFIDIGVPESLAAGQASIPEQCRRPAVVFHEDVLSTRGPLDLRPKPAFGWTDDASRGIKALNDRGYLVFVAGDLSGTARSRHLRVNAWLARTGAHVDGFCPLQRQDDAAILEVVAREWPIQPERSHYFGRSAVADRKGEPTAIADMVASVLGTAPPGSTAGSDA